MSSAPLPQNQWTTSVSLPYMLYTPLSPGDFIRYIVLQPGQQSDPLEASFRFVALPNARGTLPDIEAISYVWGDASKTCQVTIDGCILLITKNLHNALRQVRYTDRTRMIWADAICINQADDAEKSSQVAMMGRIYNAAARVLVTLGACEHTECAQGAASLITALNDMILAKLEKLETGKRQWNDFPFLDANDPIVTDSRWQSVECLLKQKWFARGWTAQECMLARDAVVFWGSTEIKWLHVVRTSAWGRREPALGARSRYRTLHLLPYYRKRRYQHEVMSFITEEGYRVTSFTALKSMDILLAARGSEVTDPRDRVYAFLGIMDDFCAVGHVIEVDYRKSCAEVYFDAAADCLASTGNAVLLHYIEHDELSITRSAFPSWVPQWDAFKNQPSVLNRHGRLEEIGHALRVEPPQLLSKSVLKVRGVVFDKLAFVSNKVLDELTTVHDILEIWLALSTTTTFGKPYQDIPPLLAFLVTVWKFRSQNMEILNMSREFAAYASWIQEKAAYRSTHGSSSVPLPPCSGNEDSFVDAVRIHEAKKAFGYSHGRRVFVTARGYIGIGSRAAREGDLCSVVFGGTKSPMLLRHADDLGHYKILGDCSGASNVITDGIIHWFGQAREWEAWGVEEQDILLC